MNKKQQTIYCVLTVIILLILFFGDQIMLHTIPENPNPNNRVFKGENKKGVYEQIDYIKEITINELKEKLDLNLDVMFYYLDFDAYEDNNNWNYWLNYDLRIKENYELTPFLMSFDNGVLIDTIIGVPKRENLRDFFKQI